MQRRVKSWPVVGLCLALLAWCGAPGTLGAADAAVAAVPSAQAQAQVTRAAPSGTPGAAPLGTTNYPIPTGAYFVAPTGSDTAAGTQAAPWATLGHAVGVAPNHSTIVMRAGIYREADVINSKALTIQPYPNEAVIVRGSNIVTGFVQSGTTWVLKNWTYEFPRQNARAVDAQHPLANAPDQVFVDGAPLTQVAKAAQVGAKSFFVDYTAHQLVIGINPAGHTIEASTKTVGLHLEHAAGTIVRGIQFDEYATPASTHGAVLDSSAARCSRTTGSSTTRVPACRSRARARSSRTTRWRTTVSSVSTRTRPTTFRSLRPK